MPRSIRFLGLIVGAAWGALACWLADAVRADAGAEVIRSRQSGPWSAASTWVGGAVPGADARVQVCAGHVVGYDLEEDRAFRSIHVAGTLAFATDRSTRLDVSLIKIQPGDDASENGFDCDAHAPERDAKHGRPALLVGTAEQPIAPGHSARIRLVGRADMDPESCPAIVCCGGRMEFHGAPMPRTWVKLGTASKPGDRSIVTAEPVPGWRVGDRILVTATRRERKEGVSLRPGAGSVPTFTEERILCAIEGTRLTLDRPLAEPHLGAETFRAEVANLSRNVIVESADPSGSRGHTMYHRNSAGSISYTEFRHLGKEGVKGRYPIHFHLAGTTMRGSSLVGAAIWDSGNRWVTIHGTNALVVRDCVGYRSVGHGFFLEDGTETLNVLDRNLAIQAFAGKRLPDQAMPFDENTGAGFWWANSLNTFTRNIAVECDRYGFQSQAQPTAQDDLKRRVLLPDGRRALVDIRTLPFVQFSANESHGQLYGISLGEGTAGVGPGRAHPLILRNTRIWDALWGFHAELPALFVAGMTIDRSRYGIFQPVGAHHVYQELSIRRTFVAGAAAAATREDRARIAPDNSPPTTVVTFVSRPVAGQRLVRGTATDDGPIRRVVVNGSEASAVAPDFSEWEVRVVEPPDGRITAHAEDANGNAESPHEVELEDATDTRDVGNH